MAFFRFWACKEARNLFLNELDTPDLCNLRLTCYDFSTKGAELLFQTLHVRFTASSFTRQARINALTRVGHHVRKLEFHMPHEGRTFLPPLLDPIDGSELDFPYVPSISSDPTSKFGSSQLSELLIRQYDPIFHSACDVASFLTIFSAIPNLKVLHISTPGQAASMRYRASAVDYALISLRMAVEKSQLMSLRGLILSSVHPASIQYLAPGPFSVGASPSTTRRWRQINTLTIRMEAWDFEAPESNTDHLKLLREYLLPFATQLNSFDFEWLGTPGPFPLTFDKEPMMRRPLTELSAPRVMQDLPHGVNQEAADARDDLLKHSRYRTVHPPPNTPRSATVGPSLAKLITDLSPLTSTADLSYHLASPPPHSAPAYLPSQYCIPKTKRIRMLSLEAMRMTNCIVNASQIHSFIRRHTKTLRSFEFNRTELRRGSWEDAFRHLDRLSAGDRTVKQRARRSEQPQEAYDGSERHGKGEPRVKVTDETTSKVPIPPTPFSTIPSNERSWSKAARTSSATVVDRNQPGLSDPPQVDGAFYSTTVACDYPLNEPEHRSFSPPEPYSVRRGIRATLKNKIQALHARAEARRQNSNHPTVYGFCDPTQEAEDREEVILGEGDALPPTPSLTAASSAASSLRSVSVRSGDHGSRRMRKLHKRPRIDVVFTPEVSMETLATSVAPVDSAVDLSFWGLERVNLAAIDCRGEGPLQKEGVLPQKLCQRRPRVEIPPGLIPPLERHPSERGEALPQVSSFGSIGQCYELPGASLASSPHGCEEWEKEVYMDQSIEIGDLEDMTGGCGDSSDGFIPILLQRFSNLDGMKRRNSSRPSDHYIAGYI